MAITANQVAYDPALWEQIVVADFVPTGRINTQDGLAFLGDFVAATAIGAPSPSAAGVALEASPRYDSFGNIVTASSLRALLFGPTRVSAAFSGHPGLGIPAYPATTGSGVAAPTGLTGVAATWQTAAPVANSANANVTALGYIIAYHNTGPAGTGQLTVMIDRNAGYY